MGCAGQKRLCGRLTTAGLLLSEDEVFQPTIIFDKSFLQMINPDEWFELCIFFEPICAPILMTEILADLQKPAAKHLPKETVKALARKMWQAPLQPPTFDGAALAELQAEWSPPMDGRFPLDSTAPYVEFVGGGVRVQADEVQRQIWARWAAGDFSGCEEEIAQQLRTALDTYDPNRMRKDIGPFVSQHFSQCRSMGELLKAVDDILASRDRTIQFKLLLHALMIVNAPPAVETTARQLFAAGLITRLRDFAPYSASLVRIYFAYLGGLGKEFLRSDKHDLSDLRYLFYAPFVKVFCSADNLHRSLWPAASGAAFFINGIDLKNDLRQRAALRKENPESVAGMRPVRLPDSVVNQAHERWTERR
jgi:hypothetical protein